MEGLEIPMGLLREALTSNISSLISEWLKNPDVMNHYMINENDNTLQMSTLGLRESLVIALKEVSEIQGKVQTKDEQNKHPAGHETLGMIKDQCQIDIREIHGIFREDSVREISLFENLVYFFRETFSVSQEQEKNEGLNAAFIHSYCAVLDCVKMEVFSRDIYDFRKLKIIFQYLKIIVEHLSKTDLLRNLCSNHHAIQKTEMFSSDLHGFLVKLISSRESSDNELRFIILNLLYLLSLLNVYVKDELKSVLVSDCYSKMEIIECDFNPDHLQIIYCDLLLISKIVKYGVYDQQIFQLLIDLAGINVPEIHLFLIRFCIENGLKFEFSEESN